MTIETTQSKPTNFQNNLKLVAELENGVGPVVGREGIRKELAQRLDQAPDYSAVLKGFSKLPSAAKNALKYAVTELVEDEASTTDAPYVLEAVEEAVAAGVQLPGAQLKGSNVATMLRELRKDPRKRSTAA